MSESIHDPNQSLEHGQDQELNELLAASNGSGQLPADFPDDPELLPPPLPQTDPEPGLQPLPEEDRARVQPESGAEPAAEKPVRKRRTTRRSTKKADDDAAAPSDDNGQALQTPDDAGDTGDAEEEKPTLNITKIRRERVIAIGEQRSVETDSDRLHNDLLDLVESLKGKRILTDSIQGVERGKNNSNVVYAVVYHGNFKVLIPSEEAIYEPEDYRGQRKSDVLYYLLNKRMGAEIDYVIRGIDQEQNMAVASRMDAMAMKRKSYFFKTDRNGNYQLYVGSCAEARVVSVIRAGIFVDLFGAECYIPLKELSYQRWVDAAIHYQPGQRVLVKITELDRSDRDNLQVSVSVKQASANPYEKAIQRYVVGERYVGTVSVVDFTGVFVSLDGGIDCLCSYPPRGRPPRGARVTVRILGIDNETCRIWGTITHMSAIR